MISPVLLLAVFLVFPYTGEESNDFGGFLCMSESYVRLKTIAIMIHKDDIPKHIADKLGT